VLEAGGITIDSVADARKEPLRAEETWQLLQDADEVIVAQRKKVLRLHPQQAQKEAILAEALGRSGTLRAPTLRLGSRFLIGWSEALYAEFFPAGMKK
jgi:arsenate reductase-like glutaredoxin family protein